MVGSAVDDDGLVERGEQQHEDEGGEDRHPLARADLVGTAATGDLTLHGG